MVTEAEFERANRRMEEKRELHSYAVKASYDPARNRVVIEMANGLEIAFDPHRTQELEGATAAELADIEISASGLGLYFPQRDADFSIPALKAGIFGTREWMAAKDKLAPVHPGSILREEFLKLLGLWQLAAEEADVTPELAQILATHFKTTPEFWLGIQAQYDREMAAKREFDEHWEIAQKVMHRDRDMLKALAKL
jgi:plasmid maintenance system antidote protein VapI